MEIGFSILIYLAIGIIVMALFCLITRYFNKKLQKALEDQNQIYSNIQQIRGSQQQEEEGNQYNQYIEQRVNPGEKDNKLLMEVTETLEPLNTQNNYDIGRLKRRLNGQNLVMQINPETIRSANSIRSFRPQKLDSRRSMLSKRSNLQDEPEKIEEDEDKERQYGKRRKKNKKNDDITYHKYVSKIVAYTEEGIFITQNNLLSVKKFGQIQEKRTVKKTSVKQNNKSFVDTLEAYGFQKDQFGAYKFTTVLEIPHMKNGQEYPVSALKNTENKQAIQFSEYYSLKQELESQAA